MSGDTDDDMNGDSNGDMNGDFFLYSCCILTVMRNNTLAC